MLTKNCRKILKRLNSSDAPYHTEGSVSQLCQLERSEIHRAVNHLFNEGYIEFVEFHSAAGKVPCDDLPFTLSELGSCYQLVRLRQVGAYIIDKWTDIVACIIAIISLIISLCK